ncbi:Jag N-terminal domain-containing protein [Campylobacter sp. faydin G-140]|nr:Jag N-terminal domain-containing protein [Campylobacter anatolicus]MBR8462686.1 Jag N-terminal domain-containing protein [Campylobacter anatolicus]MBR8466051.1 Jag N-terminal domain-containing protein [Campylobacter anatolicus]
MRIEAPNLQEAFQKAAEQLKCSVTELDIRVIQHPSNGFLGFFKKNAIIEAVNEKLPQRQHDKPRDKFKNRNKNEHKENKNENDSNANLKDSGSKENIKENKDETNSRESKKEHNDKKRNRNKKHKDRCENRCEYKGENHNELSLNDKNTNLSEMAFADKIEETNTSKSDYIIKRIDVPDESVTNDGAKGENLKKHEVKNILDVSIIDNFNQNENQSLEPTDLKSEKKLKPKADVEQILPDIKDGLDRLFRASCFAISKVEVAKFDDGTVLIELDGEDAALLIGKEGYRYKAISYLLHNWINSKYNLYVRLEIAEFLKNQEAMMTQYLQSVIERVQSAGRAHTKPLDGILVKIALEKLREKFPDKYVGIKNGNDGKFVVVNDFVKK